jgi:hypothetical protein
MQMIYCLSSSPFFLIEQVDQMYSLQKACPAAARRIAFIDLLMRRYVYKRTDVSLDMHQGYENVLAQHIPQRSRLYIVIQIMDRGLNLVYLHLNDRLMGIGQGKDLDRYTELF